MATNNKNMIISIAVAAVVVVAIIIGVVIGNSKSGGDSNGSDGGNTGNNIASVDYSNVDTTIYYGDYEGMYDLSKRIQNGEAIGEIVSIDGDVSHLMNSYSIIQKDENDNRIGTEFLIEGVDEGDYPQNGEHIMITGEVVEKAPLYYVIKITPGYINILDTIEEPAKAEENE